MLASGSFKPTKIISDRVEVLQSVTEIKRRKVIKNIDINNVSDLQLERALRVKWNVENKKLGLTLNLQKKKTFTKCEMLPMISKIQNSLRLAATFLLKAKSFFKIYVAELQL